MAHRIERLRCLRAGLSCKGAPATATPESFVTEPSAPKRGPKTLGPAYQGGLEAALAVVISMGFGVWADSYFGTSPILLFVGLAIGFGAFVVRLLRMTQEIEAQRQREGETRDDDGG